MSTQKNYDDLMDIVHGMLWRVRDIEQTLTMLVERDQDRRIKDLIRDARAKESEKAQAEGAKGTSIDVLDLTVRAYNALKLNNIYSVEQLEQKTVNDLLKIEGIGVTTAHHIRAALRNVGKELKK